jgi:hypothetical protein
MARVILKTVIVLAFLTGLGILGYSIVSKWYYKQYGEINRTKLTDNLTVVEYKNREIGILNNLTDKIVGRYDKVLRTFLSEESSHSISIVVKNDLRGYISAQTGEVIFEPQFLYAWLEDPESGLAACVNQEHKLGFVNVWTQKTEISFQFDFEDNEFVPYDHYIEEKIPILDFVFSNGICIIPGKDGEIGMIDKTGKVLLSPKYSDIINWRDVNTPNIILKRKPFFVSIGIFSEYCNGYVKITEIPKNTPASAQGDLRVNDVILKIKQENESDFKDVVNMSHEDVINLIGGEKGTKVALLVRHENDSTQDIIITRDEVRNYNSRNQYVYGVCDRNFKMLLPFEYNHFEKNTDYNGNDDIYVENYVVSKGDDYIFDDKYGILDTLFNEILPIKYDHIEVQGDSYIVQKDNKYGVFNSVFKNVLPVEFDKIYTDIDESDYVLYIVTKDYVRKSYDEKGNLLNDFYIEKREGKYDKEKEKYIEKSAFESVFEPKQTKLSEYIKYYLDGYYGIIDNTYRVVIPAVYNEIEYLGNGNFACIESEYSFLFKDKNNH